MSTERDGADHGTGDATAPPPAPTGGPQPPPPPVADGPAAPPPSAAHPDGGPPTEDQSPVVSPPPGAVSDDPPEAPSEAPLGWSVGAPVVDEEPEERRRRWPAWTLLVAAVVLGALYVAGYVLTGSRMPANTTIGGVDVSGMSPSAARAAVDEALSARSNADLTLIHEDQQFVLAPADIGLAFDLDASVDAAGGQRSWDPRDMIGLVVGDHEHDPVLDVDETLLDAAIGTIAEGVDVEVVEALITFPAGQPELREPVAGRVVPVDRTREVIEDAYLGDGEPVEVPTAVVEPQVDSEGLQKALVEIAQPAVSAPVVLVVGEQRIDLPVSGFAPALSIRVEDGTMTPYLDPDALAGPLTDSTTGIGEKAVDASIDIVNGAPVVTPGKPGVGLQPEVMSTALLPALTQTGEARSITVEAAAVEPEFTTADAEALQIKEKVGEFTTNFPYAEYRNINQSRAAELIDGYIVKPGETFSFNDTVGERTRANGFTDGFVINGGVFKEELGGGVSQTVTTLYNAAFFAGMDDVEHHPHAFYIDRYPVGREATVYYGSLDLKFKNSTDYGVLIKASVARSAPGRAGAMNVQLWSTKVYDVEAGASAKRNFRTPGLRYDESPSCVPQSPITGFDIDIFRTFKQNGQVVKTETDTAVYSAADTVVCGPRPDAAPPAG